MPAFLFAVEKMLECILHLFALALGLPPAKERQAAVTWDEHEDSQECQYNDPIHTFLQFLGWCLCKGSMWWNEVGHLFHNLQVFPFFLSSGAINPFTDG
jgi:hypothetical protein